MTDRHAPPSFRGLGYYVPAIVVAFAVLIAVFLADVQKRRLEEEYLRSFTTEQLGLLRSRLQGNILGNVKLVQGLVATLSTEPTMPPARFADLAGRIFDEDNQLRSLAIAPDFVVSLVYPLKGNERSLGLDYRKNERQRAAAMQVKELGRMIVTGPVDLVQGGRGVIARYPIHAGKDNAFFGIASAVIDLEKLFSASGFKSDMRVALAISSRAHDGGEARTFFNTKAAVDVDPVVMTIDIGHETWTMSAAPLKGWHQPSADLGLFRGGLALLAIVIVAPMFWVGYLMKDRHRHILALQDREDRLETVSQRLQLALDASKVGVWEYDTETKALAWDARMRELYGVPRTQPVCSYKDWRAALHPDDIEEAERVFADAIAADKPYITEFRVLARDGSIRHIRAHGMTYRAVSGVKRIVGANWDVTADNQLQADLLQAKLMAEAQNRALEDARLVLEHNSLHDALTRLPNRRFLDQQIALAGSGDGRPLTLLHIDLDRFKDINDTLGHAAGDEVLKQAAGVLRAHVPAEDFIARIGGDEFVLLSRRDPIIADFAALSARLIAAISEPMAIEGHDCRIGASIGIATRNDAEESTEQLLVNADIALYEAKRRGRNRVEAFNDDLRLRTVEVKRLSDDILRGLERGEFRPFFQPQFDAQTLEIVGVEALARWDHPSRGFVAPDVFLPVAESLNVVAQIDEAILDQALLQAMRWEAQGLGIARVSVNVSCQRLRDENLIEKLKAMNIRPGALTFELLESISFDTADDGLKQAIEDIKALGIEIEIDDFGSGHASIVSLLELSPKRLKIDRRLVQPLTQSTAQQSLVQSIIDIGKVRNIETVAEGVETMAHADLLRRLGCHVLQGYALARPMAAEDFLAFAKARAWMPAAGMPLTAKAR
ncbi:EAL domain-containing protein [Shinella kummerowiae]|jgi:diguanylate cyclase (GGDEF)-like protein/PAS domain S-box-containing protein|uniref:EAL domain-containing protein n=1 Tax=Shinella kummerowiae TaxID=417745 RepID=A0A6N8SFN4_9HYPH|nr:EAL domain-containing protein [Shinella kummerowiae]MXN47317.1 EAL domain-containing protein [Shinella kummerowiae]